MLVEVYTKPGCPLCDEMLELFDEVDLDPGVTVVEHNIFEQQAWFEAYRYRIPVVVIDGVEALELRFEAAQLREALNRARGSRTERGP